MNTDNISQAFVDVRRAYRLIYQLQDRLQSIVFFIKSQTKFPDNTRCVGNKLHSNPIKSGRIVDDYANLVVENGMWAWDFLYGYLFEYYFGSCKIGERVCRMSIITVCDDGAYAVERPKYTSIKTYASPEDAHSWIILAYGDGTSDIWMDGEDDARHYIRKLIRAESDTDAIKDGEGHLFVARRVPMEAFYDQQSVTEILKSFADKVVECGGANILNDEELQ